MRGGRRDKAFREVGFFQRSRNPNAPAWFDWGQRRGVFERAEREVAGCSVRRRVVQLWPGWELLGRELHLERPSHLANGLCRKHQVVGLRRLAVNEGRPVAPSLGVRRPSLHSAESSFRPQGVFSLRPMRTFELFSTHYIGLLMRDSKSGFN